MTYDAQAFADAERARRIAAGTLGQVTREIAHDLHADREEDS